MKQLCCLATIVFLSAQAYAGTILPELGRSKSQANLSPIAVGFSNRNSASLLYTSEQNTGKGTGAYGQDNTGATASVFLTTSKLHMEFGLGYTSDETDYNAAATTDSSTNAYQVSASFAMPFAEVFSAGASVETLRSATLTGDTKTRNNIVVVTPAIGMKVQPNLAVGLGVRRTMNTDEAVTVGSSVKELPSLNTHEIFAGVAYGVDQKIGENGFGVEAVVGHTLKAKEQSGSNLISQGSTTSVSINGNYALNDLDLGASIFFETGRDYNDTRTKSSQAYFIKPEYMIAGPYYVTPQVGYANTKNSSSLGTDDTSSEKGWLYGLGAGRRTALCDLELTYNHGSQDTTPSTIKLDRDVYMARFSLYF